VQGVVGEIKKKRGKKKGCTLFFRKNKQTKGEKVCLY